MKADDIYIAENNRFKCVYCGETIKKGEYFNIKVEGSKVEVKTEDKK